MISNEEKFLPQGASLSGRYIIQNVLGAGGFGITYKAWDKLIQQNVAIKEYYPSGVVSRQINSSTISLSTESNRNEFIKGKERFLAEARDLVKFQTSPNIVSVQNYFEENSTAYMAMEYLEGCTLAEYVRRSGGRLDVTTTLRIMDRVMVGLEEIHNAGIIHRDISPDNIFILTDNSVKLIDFGAAKQAYCGETQNLSIMLKPGYAPFEQYANNSPQGAWTDIYALGATMYRVLSGEKPIESISRILTDELPPLYSRNSDVPKYLSDAISKAMAVKPNDRFQSVAEFKKAIFGTTYEQVNKTFREEEKTEIVQDEPIEEEFNKDHTFILNESFQKQSGKAFEEKCVNDSFADNSNINNSNIADNKCSFEDDIKSNFKTNGKQNGRTNKSVFKKIAIIVLGILLVAIVVLIIIMSLKKSKENAASVNLSNDVAETSSEEDTQVEKDTSSDKETTLQPAKRPKKESQDVSNQLPDGMEMPDPNSHEKITIHLCNYDLEKQISYFYEKYPEYTDRIDWVYGFPGDPESLTSESSLIGTADAPDMFLIEACYVDMVCNNTIFVDLEDLGFSDDYYKYAYSYTKQIGSVNGKLRAISWQVTPGVLLYRTDIARDIFGTDDPNEVSKMFYDWDKYLSSANMAHEKGYYINSSLEEFPNVEGVSKITDTVLANNFTKGTSIWTDEWYADMNEDVFTFFATPWFVNYTLDSTKDWAICYSPFYDYWGGTFIAPTVKCVESEEKCRLANLFLYTICCDEEVLTKMANDTGDCPNNKKVVDSIAALSQYPNSKIENPNPYKFYKEALDGMERGLILR